MRAPIVIVTFALVCVGVSIAPALAQEPATTATPEPTATVPEPTPTPSASAAPEPPATPTPAESAVPTPTAEPAAPAAPPPSVGPAPTVEPTPATPNGHRRPAPSPRRRHRPQVESRTGTVQPRTEPPAPAPVRAPREPSSSPATVAPVSVGAPTRVVDGFRIPPFLLAIYHAAGMRYGVRWEVLAAINEIETDYGRNLNVSSAGAVGWMQFLPASWKTYGVDANRDGLKDPFNPVDAIFAAARYLRAAGADRDLRRAIFAYNHADWYVDSVLLRASVVGGLRVERIASLIALGQGRFPVRGRSTYAGRATDTIRHGIDIYARAGAPVIAVVDGRISRLGDSRRLGRFVQLQDPVGNTYTYAHLERLARTYPVPKHRVIRVRPAPVRRRLFANPRRPDARSSGGARQLHTAGARRLRLRPGSRVTAGTVLGRIGRTSARRAPHLRFEIRPAGRGAARIDPSPILDGWKLFEATGTSAQQVLANRRVHIYECGRHDVASGLIDGRVLATLQFLAASGLEPTVSSLRCGHSYLTASGHVSEHASGSAVDISAVAGIPILGHQGAGSITDLTIQRLLTLGGAMKPHQIISLMTFDGADNTFAMADHADHIHVGFKPLELTSESK